LLDEKLKWQQNRFCGHHLHEDGSARVKPPKSLKVRETV